MSDVNILFKTLFGSHLYGTDTEKSDKDYKGIFLASLDDIILKQDKHVIYDCTKNSAAGYRNSPDDIDIEYKELREFLREAMAGQTYALDMLFSNKALWITNSPEWEFIIQNRSKLLSKNVQPFLGYIRQQTAKYGLKGARLAELQRVLKYFEQLPEKDLIGDHIKGLELSEFVRVYEVTNERPNGLPALTETYLKVLGKKFQLKTQIQHIIRPLRKFDEEYGGRSRMAAKNEGVDWKAVSHAFRCSYQLIELATHQEIVFPLKEAEFLKQVKTGQIPWLELQDKLTELMDKSFKALESSPLPKEPDKEFWHKFIIQTYAKNRNM